MGAAALALSLLGSYTRCNVLVRGRLSLDKPLKRVRSGIEFYDASVAGTAVPALPPTRLSALRRGN